MRKKPDLILILVAVFIVGLLLSGLTKTASVEHEASGLMMSSSDVTLVLPEHND